MSDKHSILYVDDEFLNVELFAIHFQNKYNVLKAFSGPEGLDQLKENPRTKIVISDMNMPGINGLEFIKAAKKEFPEVLFYILTGYAITEEISTALEENLIEQYFSKPYDFSNFDTIFEEILAK